MSITRYRCHLCPYQVGQWPKYLKHMREKHNYRYEKDKDRWKMMNPLFQKFE